jgi:O-antigen ligase
MRSTLAQKTAFALLLGLAGFVTLAYGGVHQPIISVYYAAIALAIVLVGVDAFRSGSIAIDKSYVSVVILAAAAYGLFQVIPFGDAAVSGLAGIPATISLDPFATKRAALNFFALFLLLTAFVAVLDKNKRLHKVVIAITVFGFAYAFFAILQSFLSPGKIYGIYEVRGGTSFGSFVNRHNFAAFMEMAIALPLGLLFAGAVERDKKLLYITAVTLMGVALLLSGSRGGLVAFLAQLVFLALVTLGKGGGKKLALRIALVVLLFGAIVGGSIFVGGESSLTRIADTATSDNITSDRSHIWGVTLKMIAANMPFGAGLGAYGVAYTPHDSLTGLERVEQAHNDYLQVLSDAGLPGLIIGGAFLFFIFRLARQGMSAGNQWRRAVAIGAASGVFAILVHSIFDFVLHITAISVTFIMLIAVLIAARESYDDDFPDDPAGYHRHRPRRSKGKIASFRK